MLLLQQSLAIYDQDRDVGVVQGGQAHRSEEFTDANGVRRTHHHELNLTGMFGQIVQRAAVDCHRFGMKIGVEVPPLRQSPVQLRANQAVAIGHRVRVVDIGIARLPGAQHPQLQS